MIASMIRQWLPTNVKIQIKRYIRKMKCHIQCWVQPVSLEDMRRILVDELGIKAGDKIFVTSGFGGLNATFSPKELVLLLMDIIIRANSTILLLIRIKR